MIPPSGMAIAAITVMLAILWGDMLRTRRQSQIVYAVRVALYLVVAAIFILNMFRYPRMFDGGTRVLALFAGAVGLVGAGYFGRRLVRRI